MIFFDDVSLSFGRHDLFKNISLELRGGKIFGVTGANGAGKSTFLKLAGKIIRPDSGAVKFSSEKKIAAVTPEMKLYENLTAAENLFFSRSSEEKICPTKKFWSSVNASAWT